MTSPRDRDLFGQEIPEATPPLTRWLQRRDAATFELRRARAVYMKSIRPHGGFLLRPESCFVLEDAEESFLTGADLATIILAQAFMEHIVQDYVIGMDRPDIARRGLRAMIVFIRRKEPRHRYLLDLLDEVHRFRNPFMHLQPFDDPACFSRRILTEGRPPEEILETEARRALQVMYELAAYRW